MDTEQLAVRLAGVAGAVARRAGTGPPPRSAHCIGSIVVVDRGVPAPWSVTAALPAGDVPADCLAEALAWCRARGGARGFRLNARAAQRGQLEPFALVERARLPVYAMPALGLAPLDVLAPGLEIGASRDRAEFVAAYRSWLQDRQLAAGLVTARDLADPDRGFLVGRSGGRPVGCALIWYAGRTAYLSGIGVAANARGRGYGRALTLAAARSASRHASRPEWIWMHASADGAGLYERLGFAPVDLHLQLGPRAAGDDRASG